jgi:putative solute:sodium symporter small subunit
MTENQQPPRKPDDDFRVNFFRPRPGFMRKEVRFIWVMLAGWALCTFGFQFLLVVLQRNAAGESTLTDSSFLGFPFHHWFSGQFLIIWFILLCLFFNLFIDRLNEQYRKRK